MIVFNKNVCYMQMYTQCSFLKSPVFHLAYVGFRLRWGFGSDSAPPPGLFVANARIIAYNQL